jgi:hypothetical protein
MRSLIDMRRFVEEHPSEAKAEFFRELLNSLERGEPVSLSKMYDLDYKDFELTLDTLRDWRLHRYRMRPASSSPQ